MTFGRSPNDRTNPTALQEFLTASPAALQTFLGTGAGVLENRGAGAG